MNLFDKFRSNVVFSIAKASKINKDEIIVESPPHSDFGDLSFPCFTLSKKLKKSPDSIAKEMCKKIKPSGIISKIEQRGGYLNFFANWDMLGQEIVTLAIKKGNNFGRVEKKKKENIMVEYCHFNTHKAVHIGHIRTACLGESLSRILDFSGFNVIRVNYQGDIGPHVARCIWGIGKIYNNKEPSENAGKWLGKVYAEASKKLKGNDKYSDDVNEINRKIYAGDPDFSALWKKTRQWSLDYFDKIYKSFGIKFDRLYFESEVEKTGTEISKNLLKKGIAKESDGAILMDLEKYGLGVFLILKSDGTPLYSAKDIGLAKLKLDEYKIDKSIHVVGSEQKLYFQQLFKTFELSGSPLAKKSYHLCYELVNLPTGKMASREGDVILYEDVLSQLEKHASEETLKKSSEMKRGAVEKISRKIALSSLKYDMIKVSPNKTIIFDWKRALDFDGNAAPYLHYTYARASSIIKKAGKIPDKFNISLLKEPHERRMIKMISEFSGIVERAGNDMRPHYVANFCYDLSTKFNEFYQFLPVLSEVGEIRKARIALVKAVAVTLDNAMGLLGMESIEKM